MAALSNIVAAGVLAIGIAAAGFLAGEALIKSRLGFRTVTVKGLSEREVKADLGFWPVRFVANGANLEDARRSLEASENAVKAFLARQGFEAGEYQVQNILVEDRFAGYNAQQTPEQFRFVLTEDMLVRSQDVQKLAQAARNMGELLRAGVAFSSDSYNAGPSFVFTGIAKLKGEMLSEATQRAREAAQKFAEESGAEVGDIQSANQGVFEISPAVEIPNDRPEKQSDKKVRVVTTITYFLE
jgi:uncharacterized protein